MTPTDFNLWIVASLMALAAVGLLYLSWKQSGRPFLLTSGWALAALSCVLSFCANGDRGVAQIVSIAMAAAVAFFAVPLLKGIAPPVSSARQRNTQAASSNTSGAWVTGLSGVWTFLITGPVAGAIALLASAGLFKLMRPGEGSPATAGAFAIVTAVLLWAALSVILLMEPRPGRRSIYAGVGLVAASAAAFI